MDEEHNQQSFEPEEELDQEEMVSGQDDMSFNEDSYMWEIAVVILAVALIVGGVFLMRSEPPTDTSEEAGEITEGDTVEDIETDLEGLEMDEANDEFEQLDAEIEALEAESVNAE